MSFADDKTFELWRGFMPRRGEIPNAVGTDLYSVQVYDGMDFDTFNPAMKFEKWAAIEVTDFSAIPDGMERITLPGGLYACFLHKGAASTEGPKTFRHIFGTWLPKSGYVLDNRPYFEVLGKKYKNEDPESEEDIWIPVKPKVSQ